MKALALSVFMQCTISIAAEPPVPTSALPPLGDLIACGSSQQPVEMPYQEVPVLLGIVEIQPASAPAVPVPGIVVSVRETRGGPIAHTVTDALGRFRFPSLNLGTYDLYACMPGLRPTQGVVTVRRVATTRETLALPTPTPRAVLIPIEVSR